MLVKLAELIEQNAYNPEVANLLLAAFTVAANQVLGGKQPDKLLTFEEILIGKTKGKLHAVKAYKERTGLSLMEAKQSMEQYFERNNLKFFQ